jgi:septal ring factor EnvC (AmiA/AmiB activator)
VTVLKRGFTTRPKPTSTVPATGCGSLPRSSPKPVWLVPAAEGGSAATNSASLASCPPASLAALPPSAAGTSHTGFGELRGRLPHPVAGAEVRAVAPGRVAHAGWFKGYGNLVIVDHGDGYHTLVAHLASMSTAMGEEVEPGALLGTVGDTGSLKGTYLYFEIREKGRPIDPRAWLRSW